jgi:hypothetical protein
MALSVTENIKNSFIFAKNGLVGKWTRWLLLVVFSVIPIVNFITYGYLTKIYKGGDEAPELKDWRELLVDGVKLFIIGILYMIVPLVFVAASFVFLSYHELMIGGVLGMVGLILTFFCGFIGIAGCIRFAKMDSVKEAFNIPAVLALINEIGWGHYLVSYLVFLAVCCLIAVIINIIPLVGGILFLIITPLLLIWQGKFYENLYSIA